MPHHPRIHQSIQFLSGLLFFFFLSSCQPEKAPKLVTPSDGDTIVTNTPVLAWEPVECEGQEIWINGEKMDSVGPHVSSYVPFPLSFGENEWRVVRIKDRGEIAGHPQTFVVDDRPLAPLPEHSKLLRHGWRVQSAFQAEEGGEVLSTGEASLDDWHETSLPATALTALVRNGVYPNPYIGKNNMQIPDINDDFNEEHDLLKYSHIEGENPWEKPYWYVNSFSIDEAAEGKKTWLNFNELNYRAELWLNGEMIADTSEMVGMERPFRFDVTDMVHADEENHVAVAVWPVDVPGEPGVPPLEPFGDPGVNMGDGNIGRNYTKWDAVGWDWQPAIRDRDMGLTEDVYLEFTDDIALKDVYITSEPDLPDAGFADMVISGKLVNYSTRALEGELRGDIIFGKDTTSFTVPFSLEEDGEESFFLDKDEVEQLRIEDPKLWWPSGYGEPNLYEVRLKAETQSGDVAVFEDNHGIREVETRVEGSRIFTVNGKDIFMKGGNWVLDMTLNWPASRYEEEILMTKHANLNTLRVWGPTGVAPQAFYEAADKHGILIWQDFLNDYWGTFENSKGYQPDRDLYETISAGIVKRYRNHPSLFMWCGGNEGVNPREDLLVNEVLAEHDQRSGRFYLKSSNDYGLHGGGPYHSIRPDEFFGHPKLHGFSSEIGASGVPVIESIRRFIPEVGQNKENDHFPVDGKWAYHDAANFPGDDLRKFTALDDIIREDYGGPETLDQQGVENYFAKAQFQNYDAYRSAIGAIIRQMWNNSTGMLFWKSNSSWPSLVWQLYDWYQQPHAGYFGAKEAFSPFNVQLNRDDRSVSVINTQYTPYQDVKITATLYDQSAEELWKETEQWDVGENTVVDTDIRVPEKKELVFLRLKAEDAGGEGLSDNFYWLHPDHDFSGLKDVPSPELETSVETGAESGAYQVKVTNHGDGISLLTRLKMVDARTGQEILPVLWSDNFISVLPGESCELQVVFPRGEYAGDMTLEAQPFNAIRE
ncbi:MAG: glycosyl hydrolase 2 galactose-binding domain-containing protein [Marinilabiliaceae bacterium]